MLDTKQINTTSASSLPNIVPNKLTRKNIYQKKDAQKSPFLRSKSNNTIQKCNASFQEYCAKQLKVNLPVNKEIKKINLTVSCEQKKQSYTDVYDPELQVQQTKQNIDPQLSNFIQMLNKKVSKHSILKNQQEKQKFSKKQSQPQRQQEIITLKIKLSQEINLRREIQQQKEGQKSQINRLQNMIKNIKQDHENLLKDYSSLQNKKTQLQNIIYQGENNLAIANNTLNQLKQTINQNKIQELEFQNQKYQRLIKNLEDQISSLRERNQHLQQNYDESQEQICMFQTRRFQEESSNRYQPKREEYLNQELTRLRNQINSEKSQAYQRFQETIKYKDQVIISLSEELKNERRNRHFLQYNLNKQITDIKNKSEEQVKNIRIRYSKMLNNLKQKAKNGKQTPNKPVATINNRVGIADNRVNRKSKQIDEEIELNLSPE